MHEDDYLVATKSTVTALQPQNYVHSTSTIVVHQSVLNMAHHYTTVVLILQDIATIYYIVMSIPETDVFATNVCVCGVFCC